MVQTQSRTYLFLWVAWKSGPLCAQTALTLALQAQGEAWSSCCTIFQQYAVRLLKGVTPPVYGSPTWKVCCACSGGCLQVTQGLWVVALPGRLIAIANGSSPQEKAQTWHRAGLGLLECPATALPAPKLHRGSGQLPAHPHPGCSRCQSFVCEQQRQRAREQAARHLTASRLALSEVSFEQTKNAHTHNIQTSCLAGLRDVIDAAIQACSPEPLSKLRGVFHSVL